MFGTDVVVVNLVTEAPRIGAPRLMVVELSAAYRFAYTVVKLPAFAIAPLKSSMISKLTYVDP